MTTIRTYLFLLVLPVALTDVRADERPIISMQDARDVMLDDVHLSFGEQASHGTGVRVAGPLSDRIRFESVVMKRAGERISTGPIAGITT